MERPTLVFAVTMVIALVTVSVVEAGNAGERYRGGVHQVDGGRVALVSMSSFEVPRLNKKTGVLAEGSLTMTTETEANVKYRIVSSEDGSAQILYQNGQPAGFITTESFTLANGDVALVVLLEVQSTQYEGTLIGNR